MQEGESYEVCATISNAMDPLQRNVSFALAIPEQFASKNHRVTNLVSPRCNLSHCGTFNGTPVLIKVGTQKGVNGLKLRLNTEM